MIVFWAISPLQSSILGIDTISITKPVEMGPASQLLPLSKQLPLLGPEILNTGYAISWLGQSYPAFTNSDYGLLPFYLDNNTAPTRADTNWTANTMKYTTELDCWPAQVSSVGVPRVGQFSFLNRQGCNTTIAPPRFNNFTMSYIPYGSSPYSSYALDSPTCPPTSNNTHQFLAVMGQSFNQNASEPVDFDLTALYCQPYYYKQKVRASVKASNFEPIRSSIHPLGQKELLTEDEFNSTAFEFLLGNGIDQNPRTRDYPFDNAMELNPLVEGRNISTPIDNMVGFALAGKRRPTEDYKNPEVLRKAFEDAHKSLFSVALNTLLTNTTTTGGDSSPTSTYFLSGIKASREFCASVEACLILTSIFSFLILYLCHTTPCHLTANPSSISRMAQVFRNSPELLDAFRGSDTDSSKALTQKFSEEQFRLLRENSGISPRANSMMIERVASDLSDRSEPVSEKSEGYYDPVRPLVLTTPIGIFFFCVLAAAIAGLAYMYHQITIQGGE